MDAAQVAPQAYLSAKCSNRLTDRPYQAAGRPTPLVQRLPERGASSETLNLSHELPETRVSGAVQLQLDPPGGGNDGRVLAGERADHDVVLPAVGAQLVHLTLRQVRAVGDPDYPVVQAVDRVAVLYDLPVETAVLPDGGVVAVGRRLPIVLDGPLAAPVGGGRVDLYPLGGSSGSGRALSGFLPSAGIMFVISFFPTPALASSASSESFIAVVSSEAPLPPGAARTPGFHPKLLALCSTTAPHRPRLRARGRTRGL